MRFLLITFSFVAFTSCSPSSKISGENKNSELFRQWTHSHEDDQGDIKAYRPSDYNFPPARGRSGFEFKSDGNFIENRIAPTDGNRKVNGKWKKTGDNVYYISFDNPNIESYSITIISLENDILKLKIEYSN